MRAGLSSSGGGQALRLRDVVRGMQPHEDGRQGERTFAACCYRTAGKKRATGSERATVEHSGSCYAPPSQPRPVARHYGEVDASNVAAMVSRAARGSSAVPAALDVARDNLSGGHCRQARVATAGQKQRETISIAKAGRETVRVFIDIRALPVAIRALPTRTDAYCCTWASTRATSRRNAAAEWITSALAFSTLHRITKAHRSGRICLFVCFVLWQGG